MTYAEPITLLPWDCLRYWFTCPTCERRVVHLYNLQFSMSALQQPNLPKQAGEQPMVANVQSGRFKVIKGFSRQQVLWCLSGWERGAQRYKTVLEQSMNY